MILTHRRRKASKLASQDFISNMPDNVVATILDRLPLQDAVRTGILSRDWRSKWTTMLSQLVLDQMFLYYLYSKTGFQYKKYKKIISRLLICLKGPITKFVLFLRYTCSDIRHWILFLSQKGVKDVTIIIEYGYKNKLPTHFFSCLELKHLNLRNCYITPPANFHGFPNLLSLELYDVKFKSQNFLELSNKCPVLESLIMGYTHSPIVKLVEFAKLINLKFLTFYLCNIDKTMFTSTGTIFELVSCLPKLDELELDFVYCKPLIEDDAIKRSAITFPCLKTLRLSDIDLGSGIMRSFALEMIRSSPDLQTLEITADNYTFTEDCATKRPPTTLTYLKTLKFINLTSGFMLAFAIGIIRSSPNLQTLEIEAVDWSSIEDDTRKRFPTTLPCLKSLTLSNIDLSNRFMVSFVFKIIKSSQNLQTLEIKAGNKPLIEDDIIESSRTAFPCLKTLKLYNISLGSCIMFSLAFEIISRSPNLQTLEIAGCLQRVDHSYQMRKNCDSQLAICYPKIDCNKMGLMQLQSVVLTDLRASKNELSLIKYLLACSPFLRKVVIRHHWSVKSENKLMFARKLLKHRASTTAEIKLY